MRLLSLLALALALVGCGGGQTPIEVVTVQALRTPCQGFISQMCLTMTPDFELPETLFFGIEGYTHRWGIESELRIRRQQVDPPLADGPSELIILEEVIIEREPITAPFDLTFPFTGSDGWFVSDPPDLDLLGTTVRCEASLCSSILSFSNGGFNTFRVTMELTEDDQTLTALAVTQ